MLVLGSASICVANGVGRPYLNTIAGKGSNNSAIPCISYIRKVHSFDNKNKKMYFCFELYSLFRTFVG